MSDPVDESRTDLLAKTRHRHLLVGWWSLFTFALLGVTLEAMHGFKVPWFLDPAFETRRLLWRLAHAHGTLLAIVHLAFAASLPHVWTRSDRGLGLASTCLLVAGVLLPLGFFLGGVTVFGGDPGPGIFLAPLGALGLLGGTLRTAWAIRAESSNTDSSASS